jgi:hypothetical protein
MSRIGYAAPLYGSKEWRALAREQLRACPHCARCGGRAEVADHVVPHRLDLVEFYFPSAGLVSLCRACFERRVAERRANHDRR